LSTTADDVTDTVIDYVLTALNPLLNTQYTNYEVYLDSPTDLLRGAQVGFVPHERRCAVDLLPVDPTHRFRVRVYIVKSENTRIRYIKEDVYRANNYDVTGQQFTLTLELATRHYEHPHNTELVCPLLNIGPPVIEVVLAWMDDVPVNRENFQETYVTLVATESVDPDVRAVYTVPMLSYDDVYFEINDPAPVVVPTAVPVALKPAFSIFTYDGSMSAEFEGLTEDTVIQWSQTGGVAVVYTSDQASATITFTSTELDRKEFTVCTNPGTSVEMCAVAGFFHFPLDMTDAVTLDESMPLIGGTNPDYPERSDFSPVKVHGMIPVDRQLDGYELVERDIGSVVKFEGTDDQYTEIVINRSVSTDGEAAIQSVAVFLQNEGGGWDLERTVYAPLTKTLINLPATTYPRKVIVTLYRLGYEWQIELPIAGEATPGATDRLRSNSDRPLVAIGEINTILSKVNTLAGTDYVQPAEDRPTTVISLLTTSLVKLTARESSDSVYLPYPEEPPVAVISTLTTVLQSNFAVT
jgi:hypothetical protein